MLELRPGGRRPCGVWVERRDGGRHPRVGGTRCFADGTPVPGLPGSARIVLTTRKARQTRAR
jgi:hypothetical protein